MKFKNKITFETALEFENLIKNGDYNLSCLIIDISLENLKNKRKVIPILSVYTIDEDMIFDITLDREDIEQTLNQNLNIMEKFEDYERCQQIVEGLNFLKNKKIKKNKKNK
jgi:uncharacterized protein YlxP (DUF503 family)